MDPDSAGALTAIAMMAGFGFALGSVGFWIWALIDAAVRDSSEWQRAGQNKGMWLAVLVLVGLFGCLAFGWVGALLYLLIPRAAIRRHRQGPPRPGAGRSRQLPCC